MSAIAPIQHYPQRRHPEVYRLERLHYDRFTYAKHLLYPTGYNWDIRNLNLAASLQEENYDYGLQVPDNTVISEALYDLTTPNGDHLANRSQKLLDLPSPDGVGKQTGPFADAVTEGYVSSNTVTPNDAGKYTTWYPLAIVTSSTGFIYWRRLRTPDTVGDDLDGYPYQTSASVYSGHSGLKLDGTFVGGASTTTQRLGLSGPAYVIPTANMATPEVAAQKVALEADGWLVDVTDSFPSDTVNPYIDYGQDITNYFPSGSGWWRWGIRSSGVPTWNSCRHFVQGNEKYWYELRYNTRTSNLLTTHYIHDTVILGSGVHVLFALEDEYRIFVLLTNGQLWVHYYSQSIASAQTALIDSNVFCMDLSTKTIFVSDEARRGLVYYKWPTNLEAVELDTSPYY